jgi:hypothetical protein
MTWAAVGTAAAVGAGIGGVSAAIQGNDILTGALLGGATGALTGGAGTLASSAGTSAGTQLTTEAASQLAPELINTAAINAVPLDTVVQQAAPELLSQAAPELLSQAAPELLSQAATNVVPAGIEQITPEMINAVNQGSADAIAAQGTGVQSAGINNIGYTPSAAAPPPSGIGINAGVNPSATGPFDTGVKPMIQGGDPRYASTMGQLQPSVSAPITPPASVTPPPASNGFMQGFSQFAKDNPFLTGAGIYTVASTTGMLNQNGQQQPEEEENYTGPRLSADFQGGPYSEPNVYEEKRYNYASGGITEAYQSGGPVERMNPQGGLMAASDGYGYPMNKNPETMPNLEVAYGMASGGIASVPRYYRGDLATSTGRRGDVYSATQRFLDMYDPQSRYTPPKGADKPDVGIFRDTSASTRNKSALDAAITRQTALEKQNYVDTGAKLPRASRSAGQLNMKPQGKKAEKDDEYEYARGGITEATLGGYAAGGNPRLLKGPGDGMSDNIPAVIGRRQPARLADGEFVVPADVVSHLGNGSTEAGAKKLHSMMNNVRKARTGKKKQAPAVKANRFIPK